jgi:undecaprenyl-diphosphatase
MMLETWQAIALGVVEGITEYLPVSSTGHLILTEALLGVDSPAHKAALDTYSIAIQGGAILAVLGLYWRRVAAMLAGVFGRDPAGLRLLVNLAVAFVPTAVTALLLRKLVKTYLFHPAPVVLALALGGVWMLWLARWYARRDESRAKSLDALDWRMALGIGLFQCAALWPGTSRSMMAIAGGVLLGLRARDAAEFSFLLGVPTLGAACAYELVRSPEIGELGAGPVLIGIAVAAVTAALAVRWLVGFLQSRGLAPFGWYRLALALVLFLSFAFGWVDLSGLS